MLNIVKQTTVILGLQDQVPVTYQRGIWGIEGKCKG